MGNMEVGLWSGNGRHNQTGPVPDGTEKITIDLKIGWNPPIHH